MDNESFIAQLVQAINVPSWDWTLAFVERVAKQFGPISKEKVPGRVSYELPRRIDFSIYAKEDNPKAVMFVEITLEITTDPDRLPRKKYDLLHDKYVKAHKQLVSTVEKHLGKPSFEGNSGDEGYPDSQDAVRLAYWQMVRGLFIAAFKHEDRELPLRICIVFLSPEVQ
jgi:hypothetical protein